MHRTSNLVGLRLDKEIAELVIRLNRFGFVTYFSCAGHGSSNGDGRSGIRGRIQVQRVANREALRAICVWAGLRGIKIRDIKISPYGREQGIIEGTQVTFEPIGLTLEQRFPQLAPAKEAEAILAKKEAK